MLPFIWLLFVFPLYSAALVLLGAWIYHKGSQGTSPAPSLPRFSISRAQQVAGGNGANRLPEV